MKRPSKDSRRRYEARAKIAGALAHPSRLMILEALENREACVCDLTALIGADQSTASKHLALLRQAGLVAARKEGVKTFYRLNVRCLGGFWQCVEAVLWQNLREQRATLT